MGAPRRFDHDEARRRAAAGEPLAHIARDLGVSDTAVHRAVKPAFRQAMDAYHKRHFTAQCESCGKPCLSHRHAAKRLTPNHDGRDLCVRCRGEDRRQRFLFSEKGMLVAVQCGMIDCANGERWQPPENFPRGSRYHDLRPGGFHTQCRSCQTRARRRYRAAHREADNAYQRAYKARKRAAA